MELWKLKDPYLEMRVDDAVLLPREHGRSTARV
jgi:hypothetical protein